MKTRMAGVAALLGGLVIGLSASGQAGVYGIVERVVFEPNAAAPERAQIWGAFAMIERTTDGFTNYVYRKPTAGYLYFTLPDVPANVDNVRKEWKDLATVAGTKQAVAFGYWDRGQELARVREASGKPADPDVYYTNVGVVKLPNAGSHAGIVADLRKLIAR